VLRPIPRVIDLPAELELEIDVGEVEVSSGRRENGIGEDVKMRLRGVGVSRGADTAEEMKGRKENMWEPEKSSVDEENVKHYDVDGRLGSDVDATKSTDFRA
jgi:hypothetical protein